MNRERLYRVQALLGLVFVAAGAAKLAGLDLTVRQFDLIGLGQWFRYPFAALEIAGGLALLVPRAAVYGALVLSCLIVGATGATIGHVARVALGPAAPALQHMSAPSAVRAA